MFLNKYSRSIFFILVIVGVSLILRKVFGLQLAILFFIASTTLYFLKNYINWWAPQVHQVLVIILVLAMSLYIGQMIGKSKYWVIGIVAGAVYLGLLFKKPEYVLLIAAILITNMFSLISYDFLQIKGMFKLRDLLLIGILLPVIITVLVQHKDIKFIFGSISAKVILGFCFMVLMFTILTWLRHAHPLILSFRVARDYFYFLFFFATIYCAKTEKGLDFILKSMIGLSVLFAVLYIVQALSGGSLHILRATPLHERSIIWGVPLARSYASFGFGELFYFGLLGTVLFIESKSIRLWNIIAVTLGLIAIFFTIGRTAWFRVFAIILLIGCFLPLNKKKSFALLVLIIIGGVLLLLILIGSLRYGHFNVLLLGGAERAYSGIAEAVHPTGTFKVRLTAFKWFYHTVMKENLWFGLGFLYPETEWTQAIPYHTPVWGESSLVAILNTMGIVGLLFHFLLTLTFAIRGFSILHKLQNPVYKGLILGFMAWYIGDWIGVFTTANMISYYPITLKALAVGLTECMYYIDKKRDETAHSLNFQMIDKHM